jgi:hypothetical protein
MGPSTQAYQVGWKTATRRIGDRQIYGLTLALKLWALPEWWIPD